MDKRIVLYYFVNVSPSYDAMKEVISNNVRRFALLVMTVGTTYTTAGHRCAHAVLSWRGCDVASKNSAISFAEMESRLLDCCNPFGKRALLLLSDHLLQMPLRTLR